MISLTLCLQSLSFKAIANLLEESDRSIFPIKFSFSLSSEVTGFVILGVILITSSYLVGIVISSIDRDDSLSDLTASPTFSVSWLSIMRFLGSSPCPVLI